MGPVDVEPISLCASGRNLTPSDAALFEERVSVSPRDLPARLKLLGYYTANRLPLPKYKHVLALIHEHHELLLQEYWFVSKRADSAACGEVVAAWMAALRHGREPTFVNALNVLLGTDLAAAELVARQALVHWPDSALWRERLGFTLSLGIRRGDIFDAAEAIRAYESAIAVSDSAPHRVTCLLGLVEIYLGTDPAAGLRALEAVGDYLPACPPRVRDELSYRANILGGRLHVKMKNLCDVAECLRNAGRSPTTPVLSSFGPDVELASELLPTNADDVLAYLLECERMCPQRGDLFKTWRSAIDRGELPVLSYSTELGAMK